VLELKLAHEDPRGTDGGILRVDPGQRRIRWAGVPGEFGCKEILEASFDEVKRLRVGVDAGFVLELKDKRKLSLIPVSHALWFKKQWKMRPGLTPGTVTEGLLRGPDGGRGGGGGVADG